MKTKALISFAVTAKLICVFVFAYAKNRFSHDVAPIDIERDRHENPSSSLINIYLDNWSLTGQRDLFLRYLTMGGLLDTFVFNSLNTHGNSVALSQGELICAL